MIFDNRVEIISPGALADGLTVDDIKLGITFQRNQLIAGFCAKTMLYRGLGSGLLRAHKDGAKMQFINSESGKQFTTIIYRETTLMDEDSALMGEELAQQNDDFAQKSLQRVGYATLIGEKLAQRNDKSAQRDKEFAQRNENLAQRELLTDLQIQLLDYIKEHPTATRFEIANDIATATPDKVKHTVIRLQELGFLQRVGGKRYGHWEVLNY